jgi:hypothetical protein
MNGNGVQDIVFSDRKGERRGCYWLESPGASKLREAPWKLHPMGAGRAEAMFLTLGDLDGDGPLEGVLALKPREVLVLRRKRPDAVEWETLRLTYPENTGTAKAVGLGDINLDGKSDLVVTCEGARPPRSGVFWISDISASVQGEAKLPIKIHEISGPEGVKYDLVELLDLDGDGDLDVVTCEESANLGVIWYENPIR